jgi:2-polyprenyl-3-methyl-5-hydroxy-6-metoxy-1,4-benzoquinol methylase
MSASIRFEPMDTKTELEQFYAVPDPWGYALNPEDEKRKSILLSMIAGIHPNRTLDIGCGNGFITRELPGSFVMGVDISERAIEHARRADPKPEHHYVAASLFQLPDPILSEQFDLILITGVLYKQYIASGVLTVFRIVDALLSDRGTLVTVHIHDWSSLVRFPYLLDESIQYPYREYIHSLNTYRKT